MQIIGILLLAVLILIAVIRFLELRKEYDHGSKQLEKLESLEKLLSESRMQYIMSKALEDLATSVKDDPEAVVVEVPEKQAPKRRRGRPRRKKSE